MQPHRRIRQVAALTGSALLLGVIATPLAARVERGVEPRHQPVVDRTDFVIDMPAGTKGALDMADARRLAAWFDALGLRYGDRVTIAEAQGYRHAGLREAIGDLVASHGLLTDGEAPVTVGMPAEGSVRVVVSRSTASVPGCPAWRDRSDADLVGGLSDNYGCATAGNLAAMVADPQDLVEGRKTETDLKAATSSRAIQTYREKAPTGAGGLQVMSAGGQ